MRQVPIRELGWEFPGWDLSHFAKFGIFVGILFKYPKISKNGNPLFFLVQVESIKSKIKTVTYMQLHVRPLHQTNSDKIIVIIMVALYSKKTYQLASSWPRKWMSIIQVICSVFG